ncbi:MAG: phosphoenolpyruvate--protein phosphotransferase [Candidatus Korarchaeota archaeon]|nr:phosphoenolpyruvate--protein phosphotransferase [Candidatus Korarchaeota archaeon]
MRAGPREFRGIPASPGVAVGRAYLYVRGYVEIEKRELSEEEVEGEILRFESAITLAKGYLKKLYERVKSEIGEEEAKIYEAHLMILEDETSFLKPVEVMIREQRVNAEYAVEIVLERVAKLFEEMESQYMRERAADVRDVKRLVLTALKGKINEISAPPEESIVVAHELLPSDMATLDKSKVLGFATDKGGPTSHVAIVARTLGIPAVVGLKELSVHVRAGDPIVVDGDQGLVIVRPDRETMKSYRVKMSEQIRERMLLMKYAPLPAETKDGFRIGVFANVGGLGDLNYALSMGAEGIGLLRTEFMYANSPRFPTEEELYTNLRGFVEKMGNRPDIVRTLDIGADKPLPYFTMPPEPNPMLGWRGIRVTLDRPEILLTQVKASLRAASLGNLWVMFPMISSVEEVRKAKEVVHDAASQLKKEGKEFREDVKIGIMIETPSAVLMARDLAKEVDFFSIGTNDLTQYVMAADRTNELVSDLYSHFQPAVIRAVKRVVEAAKEAKIHVGMCGEMAGDELAIPLLVGMGLDEISMVPTSIPRAKRLVRSITKESAEKLVAEALEAATLGEVKRILEGFAKSISYSEP